jgi:hypothetical protein
MHKEAMGALQESRPQIQKWQKEGWYESYELIGLTAHGGDLNGFILLKGERAKLDELRRTDEFERFVMRLSLVLDRLGVVPGVTEAGIDKVMSRNQDMVK